MTPKSKNFFEDTIEISLWWGWEYLKEYINKMEDYLQKVTEQFGASVNEQKKKLTPEQFSEFMIDHGEEYVFYDHEFPKILRNSFFVSAYSLLEFDKGRIHRMLRKAKQKPTNLSGLIGSEICQEINNYSKLRNCIVHSNGLLKEGDRDYEDLISYVKVENILYEGVDGQEIELTGEFCGEAVDTMQKFIDAAYKESIRRTGNWQTH